MAKRERRQRIDPAWPSRSEDDHPVTELASPLQGALPPYGEVTFPVSPDELPYTHPVTEINK